MNAEGVRFSLERMRQAADEAARFVRDIEKPAFLANVMLQRAVGMSLLMAAETAVQLLNKHPEFPTEHPDFPWEAMRGMRNRIAHGYFDIDLNRVWDTARNDAPELVARIDVILNWRAQGE